jgi:L-amino acid N-acyltransferase YncA
MTPNADHASPSASTADAASICAIYNPCVATTTIAFEEEAVTEQHMAQRIVDVGAVGLPWRYRRHCCAWLS